MLLTCNSFIATQEFGGNPWSIGTRNCRHPDQWPINNIIQMRLNIRMNTEAILRNWGRKIRLIEAALTGRVTSKGSRADCARQRRSFKHRDDFYRWYLVTVTSKIWTRETSRRASMRSRAYGQGLPSRRGRPARRLARLRPRGQREGRKQKRQRKRKRSERVRTPGGAGGMLSGRTSTCAPSLP